MHPHTSLKVIYTIKIELQILIILKVYQIRYQSKYSLYIIFFFLVKDNSAHSVNLNKITSES